jgi:hypothetical protein
MREAAAQSEIAKLLICRCSSIVNVGVGERLASEAAHALGIALGDRRNRAAWR